jgi:hypothetical protein
MQIFRSTIAEKPSVWRSERSSCSQPIGLLGVDSPSLRNSLVTRSTTAWHMLAHALVLSRRGSSETRKTVSALAVAACCDDDLAHADIELSTVRPSMSTKAPCGAWPTNNSSSSARVSSWYPRVPLHVPTALTHLDDTAVTRGSDRAGEMLPAVVAWAHQRTVSRQPISEDAPQTGSCRK